MLTVLSLLLCFSLSSGAKIGKEEETALPLKSGKVILDDSERGYVWVGGESIKTEGKGSVACVHKTSLKVKDSVEIAGPALSMSLRGTHLYVGQGNGGITMLDTETMKILRYFVPVIDAQAINFFVVSPDETMIWMALKKPTPEAQNWCFQNMLRVPATAKDGDLNIHLEPDWTAFSGRHPGPCTGLDVDFERNEVYFSDTSMRGRWKSLTNAFVREEFFWNTFQYLERSILFKKSQFLLWRTGRLDSWTMDNFSKKDEPEIKRTATVDTGDELSFDLWRTLFGDERRECVWIASEGGTIAQFGLTEQGFEQISLLQSQKSNRKYGAGTSLANDGRLAILDLSNSGKTALVMTSLSNSCELGDGIECTCSHNSETDEMRCTLARDSIISVEKLSLPPRSTIVAPGGLSLSAKTTLEIPFGSKLIVQGTLNVNDASLRIIDSRLPPGQYTVVEGVISGQFSAVKLSLSSAVNRFFSCLQIPKISIRISDSIVATLHVSGVKRCAPKKKRLLFFGMACVLAMLVVWYAWLKLRADIKEETIIKNR